METLLIASICLGQTFRLWASADSHEGVSMLDAVQDAATWGKPWSIGVHLGDVTKAKYTPVPEKAWDFVDQLGDAAPRMAVIAGNHDGSLEGDENWFATHVFPYIGADIVIHGDWERYWFDWHNVRFLMMSDRNDLPYPVGKGTEGGGGFPSGAVTRATFNWWVDMVESSQDKILITGAHHMLKDTTIATGDWEGAPEFHGTWPKPKSAGRLEFIWDEDTDTYTEEEEAFENYLRTNPGSIDFWLGGHTHHHPDRLVNRKGSFVSKWGVNFINVGGLTPDHGSTAFPMSRMLDFIPGENWVTVRTYFHTENKSDTRSLRFFPLRHEFSTTNKKARRKKK